MPDAPKLNDDGTIDLTLGGVLYKLRIPTLVEYGDLMDATEQDRYRSLVLLREATADRLKTGEEGEEAFLRARAKEREADQIRGTFVKTAITKLAFEDGQAPEIDTSRWPRWAFSSALMSSMINHWDTVPFPGSDKQT